MSLDPVTLAVLKGRLEQIVDEMDATLYRTAFNPIIAEARDACHGIYHPKTGDTLVQGSGGLPIFVGAMAFAVRSVIAKVKADGGLEPGDTFVFNEPYDAGTHLNDFRLVRPVFRDGRLYCWIASVGHWVDIGGNVPGGYNPRATESFQEGVRFPPVKLIERGEMRRDIVDIILANSRLATSNYGDLNAQLNALDLGERRLVALLDEYGDGTVETAFGAFSDRAEALMRAAVAALPDGTYSFEDVLDNDGIVDETLTVALDLTIAGERMTLDFSRSSPACRGPINISRATTIAACYVALKHIFTEVPANAGCLRPIDFVVTDGSILGAGPPKPVAGYTETILRLIRVVLGASRPRRDADARDGRPFRGPSTPFRAATGTTARDGLMLLLPSARPRRGAPVSGPAQPRQKTRSPPPPSRLVEIPGSRLSGDLPPVALRPSFRRGRGARTAGGVGAVYEVEVDDRTRRSHLLGRGAPGIGRGRVFGRRLAAARRAPTSAYAFGGEPAGRGERRPMGPPDKVIQRALVPVAKGGKRRSRAPPGQTTETDVGVMRAIPANPLRNVLLSAVARDVRLAASSPRRRRARTYPRRPRAGEGTVDAVWQRLALRNGRAA